MEPQAPRSYFLKCRSADTDHLHALVRGWDLNFRQLDRGAFEANFIQVGDRQHHFDYFDMNRLVDQQGTSPPGVWTFAFLTEDSSPFTWRGCSVEKGQMMIYSPASHLEAQSRPGFEILSLSFSEEGLCEVGRTAGLPELKDLVRGAELISCDRRRMQILRRNLREFHRESQKKPTAGIIRRFWEALQFDIPSQLLEILVSSRREGRIPRPRMRESALRRALQVIEAMTNEPPTVQDLCRIAGASERLLRYAFLERFGISPKAYLTAVRLNGVRRDLHKADPSATKIIEVAGRWGFWHMGQFAAEYRRLFGELPSETLGGPPQGLLENLMMVEKGSRAPIQGSRAPMKDYLLEIRLNGVRRELQTGDASARNMHKVAGRWGFWDLGKFAAEYRKRFGELPSETPGRSSGIWKNISVAKASRFPRVCRA